MNKPNPTIARLDRIARRAGLDLIERGPNSREIVSTALGRVWRYKPGGKGIVRIEAFIGVSGAGGLDAVAHRTIPQMEDLFMTIIIAAEEAQ